MARVKLSVDKDKVHFNIPLEPEKVIYEGEDTYVKLGSRNHKDEFVYGTLLMIEKSDGVHIEWKPKVKESEVGVSDSWAIIEKEREYEMANEASEGSHAKTTQFHYRINFEVANLRSFKRMTRGLQPAYIIFILDDGSTHPPIYFQKGGSNKFITQLERLLIVTQSHTDNNMFLVSAHQEQALETSFDQLNLFDDKRSALKQFTADPVGKTLGAFARLPRLLTDALLVQDPQSTMAPDFHDQLRMSIDESETALNTVSSSQPEDPDFCFVDEKTYLPEVPRKPRERPLDRKTWNSMLDTDGKVCDASKVKHHIFRGGVIHELRCEVWKFLLGYYPWDSTLAEREELRRQKVDDYFAMKLQWKTMKDVQKNNFVQFKDRESLIEKDVNRTDRTTPFFSGDNNDKLVQLNDILMTYVMYNFDLGYVQGMSDLLSPILLVMNNEVDAFWCFVGYMDMVESNFELDQAGMKLQMNQLNQILQVVDRKLYNYLDKNESSNMYFAFRWILILFKREFSMTDIMRLWEVYWTKLPCENYQLIMAISLLTKCGGVIMENKFGFTEILKHINDLSGEISLEDLLESSETLAQQLLTCEKLPTYITKIISNIEPPSQLPSIDNLSNHSGQASVLANAAQIINIAGGHGTPPPRPTNSPARKSATGH